ncbi:MAG: ATP-binding protein [Comamonadaceae bacterium]|nr:MAG: ATP-binding protein [Comamonadaceae bacterium]
MPRSRPPARLGAGKLQLQKAPLELGAQVAEIVESLRPQALRKSQHLSVLLPSGPITIEADRHRLHQIVFNLVHNAIKYTPREGRIWVHCAVEADYGVVKVEDTGVGIAPDVMPTIFELFTQENPHQSEGGFGVGLSLVKDLVDAHDGFVEAACDGKGKGAMFIVRLPMAG